MNCILEMKDVEKTFNNSIRALNGACLRLEHDEIHALVGENAAGKSTLMNVLYGIVCPDNGDIFLNGEKCSIQHPADAIQCGIGMVHQHFKLVPDFTVLENIILGREKSYVNRFGKIDFKKAQRDVEELLGRINIELDLNQRTDKLSIGLQSKVEIIKTLFRGARIIIFDEPTTVLAPNEVDNFLNFLRGLKKKGCTMIYISHRLKEIFEISDSITVLRHGQTVTTLATKETSMGDVASLMIGREVTGFSVEEEERKCKSGQPVLQMKGVCVKSDAAGLQDINLTVHEGEILGVAGIEGNGQVELADTLIGVLKNQEGSICIKDINISRFSPSERRALGLRYVPDDRIRKGLAFDMSIAENAIMGYEKDRLINKNKILMDWRRARGFAQKIIDDFRVEGTNRTTDKIGNLSGGNMQKLIVGREIITKPQVVVLSQPTVGIDFDAQRHIHKKIIKLKEEGSSILVISADLDELIALSDRIIVLYRGRIVNEFKSRKSFDEKELGYYMTGVKGFEAQTKFLS